MRLKPPVKLRPPKKPVRKQFYPMFRGMFFGLVFAGLFSAVLYVFAVPPDSKYDFSETLSPSCTPGSTNCSVVAPAVYSFAANNFSGTGTFTTTGLGTFGSLTVDTNTLYVDATNNRVGIGTATPGSPFQVNKTVTDTDTYNVYSYLAPTATTGTHYYTTNRNEVISTVTGNSTTYIIGVSGDVYDTNISAGVTDTGYRIGIRGDGYIANASSAGTLSNSTGIMGRAGINGATSGAAVTIAYGVRAAILNDVSGTTITTASGLYIDAAGTTGTITNNYGIYQAGTVEKNYFGGKVGIGIATPGYLLDVSGTTGFGTDSSAYTAHFFTTNVSTIGATPNLWVHNRGANNDLAQIGMGYGGGASNPTTIIGEITTAQDTFTKGAIFFATRDVTTDTAPTERIRITSAGSVGIGTTSPTYLLSLGGTAAREIWMERNTTAATAGQGLTLSSGGAIAGTANLNGGDLTLQSGISTGSGSSDMFFQTATAGASATTDRTQTTKFTVRGNGNVVVGTGTALATTATAGFLYIPTSAGAQTGTPVADTTGTSPIAYDTTNNRLYIYNPTGTPAWKYIAITGGFQIPDYETADPISGEKIEEGDIVLGRIDKTMEDSALHATWVTWNSVKKQLLAEARGELSKTTGAWGSGTVEGVETETFLDKVKNILFSLGISVKDGLVSIANLAVEKLSVKNVRVETLEMVDKATGEIYCTWLENGELVKAKGECSQIATAVATENPNDQIPNSNQTLNPNDQTTSEAAPTPSAVTGQAQEIIQQAQETANQAQQAVEEKVQQVVEQAAESADKAAKDAVKEMKEEIKEEIKQEVKEELQAEKSQAPMSNTQPNSNDENLNNENAAGEQPTLEVQPEIPAQPEQPSVGDIIQESAAGLLNAMWEFVKWIFGTSFNGASKIVPDGVKESSAGLMQKANDFIKNILNTDFETILSGAKSAAGAISIPIKNIMGK